MPLNSRLRLVTNIKPDIQNWLLENTNPSVKYFSLRDLLFKKEDDKEVIDAKKSIMTTGVVPKILSKQKPGGYWESEENFYIKTKYKGTVWTLILLAELNADGKDKRIQDACELVFQYSQDKSSGAFSYAGHPKNGGQQHGVIPCLTGNMLWCFLKFGYFDDIRVKQSIDWITKYLRFDDRSNCAPDEWPYKYEQCWSSHTCIMGIEKCLKALTEIPTSKRTKAVNETIKKSIEFILNHRIYKRSSNPEKIAKKEWLQFMFPTMWKYDIIETLLVLKKLGVNDERMNDASELIRSKQNSDGTWNLDRTWNGRMQASIDRKNSRSKWITLRALKALENHL